MKKELRAKLNYCLSDLSDADIRSKSENLSAKLLEHINNIFIQNKRLTGFRLGGFSPIQKEPLWFTCFEENTKCVAEYSVVHMEENRDLKFYKDDDLTLCELYKSKLVLETDKFIEVMPEIIIVPGIGFTKMGERLGRGGGYFDSFLSSFDGLSIGVCFEEQLVEDVFPETHDQRVNYLITEKNIYLRG